MSGVVNRSVPVAFPQCRISQDNDAVLHDHCSLLYPPLVKHYTTASNRPSVPDPLRVCPLQH